MRKADTEKLVARAVQEKTGDLLAGAAGKSSRVIDDADLSGLFGIDMVLSPALHGFHSGVYVPDRASG